MILKIWKSLTKNFSCNCNLTLQVEISKDCKNFINKVEDLEKTLAKFIMENLTSEHPC